MRTKRDVKLWHIVSTPVTVSGQEDENEDDVDGNGADDVNDDGDDGDGDYFDDREEEYT